MSKPNILWIMADQFRADALSCAGGPGATPNLDALARDGVRFSNCSTVAPLCVPARISMMTRVAMRERPCESNSSRRAMMAVHIIGRYSMVFYDETAVFLVRRRVYTKRRLPL